jgi:hypothetical protein
VGSDGRRPWPVTSAQEDARRLRRLYITEATPDETEDEAGAAAMEQVAGLFPDLIVTGVHRVERRVGGWYAEVTTRERSRKSRKRTMPTHGETRTRVTAPLNPLDVAEEELAELRRLSEEVLDDSEAFLVLAGEPESGDEAAVMLDALRTVKDGGEPASDEEAAIVALIGEYLGEPPPEPASSDDASKLFESLGTGSEPTKRCSKCNVPKPLTEFRADRSTKDGRSPQCKECRSKAERERYVSRRQSKSRDTKTKEAATGEERDSSVIDDIDHETSNGKPATAKSNGHAQPADGWKQLFDNPTLDRLEHLRAFLEGASFDETVTVVREISRLAEPVGAADGS